MCKKNLLPPSAKASTSAKAMADESADKTEDRSEDRPARAAQETGEVVHVSTQADFQEKVVQSNLPVVVDFYRDGCGPCSRMKPIVKSLAEQFAGKVRFVMINTVTCRSSSLVSTHKILGVPTFLFYKDGKKVSFYKGGKKVSTVIGAQSKDEFKKLVEQNLL